MPVRQIHKFLLTAILLLPALTLSPSNHQLQHSATPLAQSVSTSIRIGDIVNVAYQGTWKTSQPDLNGYIRAATGSLLIGFSMHNYDAKKLLMKMVLLEGEYADNRSLSMDFDFVLSDGLAS